MQELLSAKLQDAAAAEQLCGGVHRWSAFFVGPECVAAHAPPQPGCAANGVTDPAALCVLVRPTFLLFKVDFA